MGPLDYHPAYVPASPVELRPSANVGILKVDSGYIVVLSTAPKPPRPIPRAPSPFVGLDPDELIDRILDGMGALIRTINDKGAGEDWKDGEDRAKVREAFRAMFPELARKVEAATEEPEPLGPVARHENHIFKSKTELLEYLNTNL